MSTLFRTLVPVFALAFAVPTFAQSDRAPVPPQERHSEVRLTLPADLSPHVSVGQALAERLATYDVHLDHTHVEHTIDGPAYRTVLSESELKAASAAGLGIEVLVEDLAASVAARAPFTEAQRQAALARGGITGNVFGSMGGFPTYSEALAILDDMQAQYPALISVRASLGSSHEGRGVWMVEVGDNPGVDEGEPEALITALHHAREPAALTTVLYTLWYLLENYESNREVNTLLNSRRLFVVPILNPDGYVYNETTNPNGGGFWRKNRRNNGGGSFGVDPNRNYGYQWAYNNTGSSGNSSSSTYRGPSAFSEPEVRAVRDFLEAGRSVSIVLNYHTYGDLWLYAWAYDDILTPDHAEYTAYAQAMTAFNGYEYGPSPSILYPSNGNANDWFYGEQTTKPRAFSYTPEVGPEFWPPASQIIPLAEENLRANITFLKLAEPAAVALNHATPANAVSGTGLQITTPFRDATMLSFTLEASADVRLVIYDALGREVAVLAEGPRAAGSHRVRLDATDLPTGTYFARLTTGAHAETRTITHVR